MLNHSLFLRPPSLPWCWGRASPSSPRRASRLVHEHGQRCLPALAHCPRCTRLEPLFPTWTPAYPPPAQILCPPALPSPRRRVLPNLPQEHLPSCLPAELHPASSSQRPFLLTLPKPVPTQDTITGLLGPCQAQARPPCPSAAPLLQETPGWPHSTPGSAPGGPWLPLLIRDLPTACWKDGPLG